LEEQKFERLGAFETEKVEIGETSQLGRDLEISAGISQEDARIDEIGLTLFFAGAERRNQAAWRGEENSGAEQANRFAIPEAE